MIRLQEDKINAVIRSCILPKDSDIPQDLHDAFLELYSKHLYIFFDLFLCGDYDDPSFRDEFVTDLIDWTTRKSYLKDIFHGRLDLMDLMVHGGVITQTWSVFRPEHMAVITSQCIGRYSFCVAYGNRVTLGQQYCFKCHVP